MSKKIEITPLKKGKSEFNLVGKVKVNDYTFKLDVESAKANSDWVYNQLNLGVDCGDNGMIYASMMGGYGTDRNNVVYVHGKKEKDGRTQDDFDNRYTIAWEDRHDEDILEDIGEMCFITVGLEKDVKGKTDYKKFLTEYDAISYINEVLEDGMTVNIKGNLQWRMYKETLQAQKNITSIVLSKVEESKDYKATFTQSMLLDDNAIGKLDKETRSIPITGYIIDHAQEYEGKLITRKVNGKTVKGINLPLVKTFEFKVGEDVDKAKQMLKQFKVKSSKKLTQLVVVGYFSRGEISTVEVSEDDIPDDIKEMIELGFIDKEEILGKMAKANGANNSPEQMIIKSPNIIFKGEETKLPVIDKVIDAYTLDDINISLILENCNTEEVEDDTEDKNDDTDLDKALDSEDKDDDDDTWLDEL